MAWIGLLVVFAGILLLLAHQRLSSTQWSLGLVGLLVISGIMEWLSSGLLLVLWLVLIAGMLFLHGDVLRLRLWATVFARLQQVLPRLSKTEQEAIDAGTIWWDAELFSGAPQWRKLLAVPAPVLTDEETLFLIDETEKLCAALDDWDISEQRHDLPPAIWQRLKEKGYLGMIIPKEYGGKGFSHLAHSSVVMKLSARSTTAGVTVMVPNSLGPAELLLHYGTEAQKQHYLPRLADGREIPCFALTGPFAGSDASAIPDIGVLCEHQVQGETMLGFRINFGKRYITLAPVATVIALAFSARDPQQLLGQQEDLGITVALVPATTDGVHIGDRHNPLGAAFLNGPITGKDVFVPLDWVIGGQQQIGNGWKMLVESLAAGRGISLPAFSVGIAKLAARMTGAYARLREQFGRPIGHFEGVQEALGKIAGYTYMMDASRYLTLTALHQGERPAVLTAISKAYITEYARQVINLSMDVHGGKGICMGPANYLGRIYQQIPIGITVEGANILTRSLIVFGQGAIRSHPYMLKLIEVLAEPQAPATWQKFDGIMLGYLGHLLGNTARAICYGISWRLVPVPLTDHSRSWYAQISRWSAAFAVVADAGLLRLGGSLKQHESFSGRMADALAHLYLASAVLKRFRDTGSPEQDWNLVEWSCRHALDQVQSALDAALANFPSPKIGLLLRPVVFPLGRRRLAPGDALNRLLAFGLMEPSETLMRLTEGIYLNESIEDPTGKIDFALQLKLQAEPLLKRLREQKLQQPWHLDYAQWLHELLEKGQINADEASLLDQTRSALESAIAVDAFPQETGQENGNTEKMAHTSPCKRAVKKPAASSRGRDLKRKPMSSKKPASPKKPAN